MPPGLEEVKADEGQPRLAHTNSKTEPELVEETGCGKNCGPCAKKCGALDLTDDDLFKVDDVADQTEVVENQLDNQRLFIKTAGGDVSISQDNDARYAAAQGLHDPTKALTDEQQAAQLHGQKDSIIGVIGHSQRFGFDVAGATARQLAAREAIFARSEDSCHAPSVMTRGGQFKPEEQLSTAVSPGIKALDGRSFWFASPSVAQIATPLRDEKETRREALGRENDSLVKREPSARYADTTREAINATPVEGMIRRVPFSSDARISQVGATITDLPKSLDIVPARNTSLDRTASKNVAVKQALQAVKRGYSQLESAVNRNSPPAVVQSEIVRLSQAASNATAFIPAMKEAATQLSMMARAFVSPLQEPLLMVRIVEVNLPDLKARIAVAAATIGVLPNSRRGTESILSRELKRPEQRVVTKKTAEEFAATRFIRKELCNDGPSASGKVASGPAGRIHTVASVTRGISQARGRERRGGSPYGEASRKLRTREVLPRVRKQSGRGELRRPKEKGKLGVSEGRFAWKRSMSMRRNRIERAGKEERLHSKFTKARDKGIRQTPKSKIEAVTGQKKATEMRRQDSRRFDLLKRHQEIRRERSANRRRPGMSRDIESALQQELAKLTSKALKKMLVLGRREEDLLGLFSLIEQRIVRKMIKKLDAATATYEVIKVLQRTRKKKKAKTQIASSESNTEQSSHSPEISPQEKISDGAITVEESGPSKSLDLVTGKVDDGNSKNGYQSALI